MTRTHLIALCVSATLVLRGTSYAATLYQYNFDNGTSGTWTSSDASWTICRTVTTGTPEYCQTDATAAAATTSFDGDPAWGDYSVEADVKLYNYQSGEIGIIGHAQDASHYYRLSLKGDPTTGPRMVVALENRRRRRHRARVWRAGFPARPLLPAQAHLLQATHPGVRLARSGPDLQFVGLCRRHAIPDWKDRPDDEQHEGRLRQCGGELRWALPIPVASDTSSS